MESIATLTAAIASGMGVTVLPESAARSLCGAVNGWMSHYHSFNESLSLSLNLPARANLSPQAQAVKELLMSVISSPVMEKGREMAIGELESVISGWNKMRFFIICYAGH